MILLSTVVAQGQSSASQGVSIKIGGNVYGGGNKGKVKGNTRVTVKAGDIGATDKPDNERPLAEPRGRVFGGARMADVGGNTFVNIDGEHATGYMVINQVYGGNDVAGTIGTGETVPQIPRRMPLTTHGIALCVSPQRPQMLRRSISDNSLAAVTVTLTMSHPTPLTAR